MHIHPQLHTHHSTARDMTQGSIVPKMLLFAVPLILSTRFSLA